MKLDWRPVFGPAHVPVGFTATCPKCRKKVTAAMGKRGQMELRMKKAAEEHELCSPIPKIAVELKRLKNQLARKYGGMMRALREKLYEAEEEKRKYAITFKDAEEKFLWRIKQLLVRIRLTRAQIERSGRRDLGGFLGPDSELEMFEIHGSPKTYIQPSDEHPKPKDSRKPTVRFIDGFTYLWSPGGNQWVLMRLGQKGYD